MKLKNKLSGEIKEFALFDENELQGGVTLESLTEEWEDYKEPIDFWTINLANIEPFHIFDNGRYRIYSDEYIDKLKSIGFKFDSEEETEEAVEKLKALQRLKDKGAKFYGWSRCRTGTYELYLRWKDRIPRSYEVKNDLNLLFGGKE